MSALRDGTVVLVSGITGRWGLLFVALPLAWVVVVRLGTLGFRDLAFPERLLGGATCALALFVAGIRLLGATGELRPSVLLAALALLAVGLTAGPRAPASPRPRILTAMTVPLLIVTAGALAMATVAARWLPVWQWDALGYHLPFVDFALQQRSLAGVPNDVPYLSTYPHNVELCFLAFRAMLPDDRLVDLAQIPFGLLGALATTAYAWRIGGGPDALVAGLLWLTLPAVFLQLPTDYIDVACAALLLVAAYWALARPTARTILCAGLALGLYLGSKPNAPVATALLFALLAVQAWRAGLGRWIPVAGLLTLVFGAEAYVHNFVRHGNPIWPVRVAFGPLRWPGTESVENLLAAGAAAPRVHGPLPWRVLVSWTGLRAPPAFDMRIGGFGVLYPLTLVVAAFQVVRERAWRHLVVAAASLASPDPAVARFVLAFPALVLALSIRSLGGLTRRPRAVACAVLTASAAWNVAYAAPGLTGEGPPLLAYAHMTDPQRERAVGADGLPTPIIDARERLRPGQAAAYDRAFDLPYLAWAPDLSTSVVRIPDDADQAAVERLIEDHDVHLLLVGRDEPAGILARSQPDRFVSLFSFSACKATRCAAYYRL